MTSSAIETHPVKKTPIEKRQATTPPIGGNATQENRFSWPVFSTVPLAIFFAMAIHNWASVNEAPPDKRIFWNFLFLLLALAGACAIAQRFLPALRRYCSEKFPIIAGGIVALSCWQIVTSGLRLLPLPYFPGPSAVLQTLVSDWAVIFDSTWHSLLLLLTGYSLGVITALTAGICIGWYKHARYWGMPVLKVLGPIPATAWIPLAMVIAPSGFTAAAGLVAVAVWFPVTMLTMSGIANTRASYLDVARTLGADQKYLIFRVAIPAAMPSIFIGLFMGLGSSFITLIVAETVGVKSGLGWYISWAQGWAEYGKVFSALVIMAIFFSTIMTALFKLRDRVLAWQKGTIKW